MENELRQQVQEKVKNILNEANLRKAENEVSQSLKEQMDKSLSQFGKDIIEKVTQKLRNEVQQLVSEKDTNKLKEHWGDIVKMFNDNCEKLRLGTEDQNLILRVEWLQEQLNLYG